MSIARAVADMRANQRPSEIVRHDHFRAVQETLDTLIEETETLVLTGTSTVPDEMRQRIRPILISVHGRAPGWLDRVTGAVSMHDHLLVSEGPN